jgi:hypothetical protein
MGIPASQALALIETLLSGQGAHHFRFLLEPLEHLFLTHESLPTPASLKRVMEAVCERLVSNDSVDFAMASFVKMCVLYCNRNCFDFGNANLVNFRRRSNSSPNISFAWQAFFRLDAPPGEFSLALEFMCSFLSTRSFPYSKFRKIVDLSLVFDSYLRC